MLTFRFLLNHLLRGVLMGCYVLLEKQLSNEKKETKKYENSWCSMAVKSLLF